MSYTFLLWVGIIFASTKVMGILVRKIGLPEVVGYLIAGILIGPSCLNLISMEGDNGVFLEFAAEFGVIFLMFDAGLTTDIKEMKKNFKASMVVAVLGVIVPLIVGTFVYAGYYHMDLGNHRQLLESLFVGVVLTATSVSITVQTLKEMGCLNGAVGTTILGAAVIDDILGIIVLTIVSSMQDSSVSMVTVLLKIVIYFVLILCMLLGMRKFRKHIKKYSGMRGTAAISFALAFIVAYISEVVFGITDITGAYFVGLLFCITPWDEYVDERTNIVSDMFFSNIFFACIGIKVTLGGMNAATWVFALILTLAAILSKLIGCGFGAYVNHFKLKECLQIGVGMISRGEVALIVAEKGRQFGLVSSQLFGPIVLVVIATTLITPIGLKMVFSDNDKTDIMMKEKK